MTGRRKQGFTLIELLVVIAVIAVLMGILMPVLGRVRKQAKMVVCKTRLKNIHLAMVMYADDNDGRTHASPNQGIWYSYRSSIGGVIKSTDLIDKNASKAYWGVAYFPYCKEVDTFVCPSSRYMDDLGDYANSDLYFDATYGLNGFLSGRKKNRKVLTMPRASERILALDHLEHFLDNNGDMLHVREGDPENLVQWRQQYNLLSYNTPDHYPDPLGQIYRHARRCNLLWLDGHVSDVKESQGFDIEPYWFCGDAKSTASVNF
jgi:prepilin-type N-terminal cleavage/methylation domain-containing protein/prepilin-type processing-associated H-X9-DG protein